MDESIYYAFNPWWQDRKFNQGIMRPLYLNYLKKGEERKQIEILAGSRRIGKTTLLKQYIHHLLLKNVSPTQILYISCDHPQVSTVSLRDHLNRFRAFFPDNIQKKQYLFFDEVQELADWQIQLKSLYDLEDKIKMYCTGSTSTLLKAHGGKLTGRQITEVIHPLSFEEYLTFKKREKDYAHDILMVKAAEEYMQEGGYPEYVLHPSVDYMTALIDDIFLRDIIRLYPIRYGGVLKDLFKVLAASVGSRISYNKISSLLGLSIETIKEYIGYFENAFLVVFLEKWSSSIKDRIYAQKKVYVSDTGLKTLFTGRGDYGAKAESCVYRKICDMSPTRVGYWNEGEKEIDFVYGDWNNPDIVEVKYTDDQQKIDTWLHDLNHYFKEINPASVTIVTKNIDTEIECDGLIVRCVPLWRWMLGVRDGRKIMES